MLYCVYKHVIEDGKVCIIMYMYIILIVLFNYLYCLLVVKYTWCMYSQSKENSKKNLEVHVKCSSWQFCTTLCCTCLVQFHINTNTETVYSAVPQNTV